MNQKQKHIGKKTKVFILSTIVVLVIALLILSSIWIYQHVFLLQVTDINKYLQTDGVKSLYYVFPAEITPAMQVNEYHYYDYRLKDGCEIILDATYNKDDFENEIKRIESIKCTTSTYHVEKSVKKDNGILFSYETYISKYDDYGKYEYAVVDYNNFRIIYVFLDCITKERVSVPPEYLPRIYNTNLEREHDPTYDLYSDHHDIWYE